MEIEKLIMDTFTAHEHIAPEADEVLAATRKRIGDRGPRRSLPLAVAAGVAALTLAAVGFVVLRPADGIEAAGPTNRDIEDLTMPFTLGWLPEGQSTPVAQRINIGATTAEPNVPVYGGEYLLTVETGGTTLDVDVQEFRQVPVEDGKFKSGPGTAVTIGGKRGVETSVVKNTYELYLEHPDSGSLYVSVARHDGKQVAAQQLVDTGRRIAENVRFPGTTGVTPHFGIRDGSADLAVCAFDLEYGTVRSALESHTSYQVGSCDDMPPVQVSMVSQDNVRGANGRAVQGHETRHAQEKTGYRTLYVLDAVNGGPVVVGGAVSLEQLYAVAERLILPF